jgi:tetratricopeptide (TPR) repeat protein
MVEDDSRKVSAAAAAALGETAVLPPADSPRRAEIQHLLDQATEERDAGQVEQAEDRYWAALDLALQERARRQEGWAWDGIGSCRWRAEDFGTAMRFFVRADRIADEVGDTKLKAWCLCNFGDYQRKQEKTRAAKELYEQSLAVAVAGGHHMSAGWTHHRLAELALAEKNVDRAWGHYEAAARHGVADENRSLEGWSLIHLAECEEAAGNLAQAHARFLEAARVGRGLQPPWVAKAAAKGLARIGDPPNRGAHA